MNTSAKKKRSSIILLVIALFLLISVIADIVKVVQYVNAGMTSEDGYVTVQATISDISVSDFGDWERATYTAYVTYTYQGEKYENVKLNLYSSDMYIGKTLDILCDPERPDNVKVGNESQFYIHFMAVFAGLKLCMATIICILMIHSLKKESAIENVTAKSGLKRAKGTRTKISVIFVIVGLILIVGGSVLTMKQIRFSEKAEPIQAEIVEIDEWKDSDDEWHKNVFVTYEYQGQEYGHVQIDSSTYGDEGDIIYIYVNAEDPSDISADNTPSGGIMLIVMGVFIIGMNCFGIKGNAKESLG